MESAELQPITPEQELRFERELMPHADALFNFAMNLTYYNEEDSSDLVQETYLKALRFMDKYVEGTNPKAWLFTILKNGFINEYRKKVKQPIRIDFDEVNNFRNEEEGNSLTGHFDLRQELLDNMMGDEVTTALNALGVEYRTAILLCDIEGFTYEEIAVIADIPIGTVRSRLHRARTTLKEKLKEYAQQQGFKTSRKSEENE